MLSAVTRVVVILVALLAILSGVLAWGLEHGWFELPLEEITERYKLPDSQFVDVDGVPVHYVDQGSGSPIVILHASFLNLRSWDAVADRLASRYRVIRLDLSGAGLTGTDPTGNYGIDRNIDLVQGLMKTLGLQKVALVGTSSGGISAFRMAARAPQQVSRLILINSAGMPRTAATNPNRTRPSRIGRWIDSRFRSKSFWDAGLNSNFVAPNRPSDELIQMTYDMNRRAGGREISALFMKNFSTGDPKSTLARITAPTLILWGKENSTVMHLEADVMAHWLTNAPRLTKKYPGLGHYAYVEEPELVARDIDDFLAGSMDGELQRPCEQGG